jgi:hypothetical protein
MMARKRPNVVKASAQMWPRVVFDFDDRQSIKDSLRHPGVYVLFRDDEPYYVGKTERELYHRIKEHAVRPRDRYYHFWNYFSAFVVPRAQHRDEVEGVLIASMPTANSAAPRIKKIHLPKNVTDRMRDMRKKTAMLDE